MLPADDFLLEVDQELVRIFFAERIGMALQGEAALDRVDDVVRQLVQAAVRRDRQTWPLFWGEPGQDLCRHLRLRPEGASQAL